MALPGGIATIYALALAGLLGLAMGSFINCWAWRYLNGESVMHGRSHCTSCGHDLAWRDLVPVLSWALSRGKCRYCASKVSVRYPITEIVCALVFMAIVGTYGLTLETVELLAFSSTLLFLTLTDLDDFLIPNGCIFVALGVRVAYLAYAWMMQWLTADQVLYYVASAFGMGLALLAAVLVGDKLFGRATMGGGDLKLFFVAGLYFGWQQGLFLIIVSCVIGIIAGLAYPVAIGSDEPDSAQAAPRRSRPFPFGPSIAAACVITMLFGEPLVTWYLGFL